MERNLKTAEQKHEKTKEQHERSKKKLLDLQAGIENLCSKLTEIKLDMPDSNECDDIQKITMSNLVEGLEQSRKKLKLLF
mmetsp:Transcript_8983/g.15204  ORF Transcript_8983/g.15204 Transcript_8983/m.15204 type:complete len:80 (+) Transcript_8983:308-547(+)